MQLINFTRTPVPWATKFAFSAAVQTSSVFETQKKKHFFNMFLSQSLRNSLRNCLWQSCQNEKNFRSCNLLFSLFECLQMSIDCTAFDWRLVNQLNDENNVDSSINKFHFQPSCFNNGFHLVRHHRNDKIAAAKVLAKKAQVAWKNSRIHVIRKAQ